MDRFPEAFERYEDKIDVDRTWTFDKLLTSFGGWASDKWKNTRKQKRALGIESELIGIKAIEKVKITLDEKIISYVNKYGNQVTYTRKAQEREIIRNVVTGKFDKEG